MATYCVSDIHGNLKELKALLEKIQFKYDGSDRLIIVGDMVDWGRQSIETLLFCMELDKEYEFVTVLMGNHDYMMLEYLLTGYTKEVTSELMHSNWGSNGGVKTFKQYIKLNGRTKKEIIDWLSKLKYAVEGLEVGDRKFYVTHSSPLIKTVIGSRSYYKSHEERMIWERIEETDNPMKDKLGDNKSILVYGHTITNNYDSIDENGKCKIFINLHNQKICIDCGGKVLGKKAYARLACLRLDDLKEYYIEEEGELSNAE